VLASYQPTGLGQDPSRGEARLWDALTGQALTPPLMLGSTVAYHAFSADGRRLLLVEGLNTARVWDVATGRPLTPPIRQEGQPFRAVLSPDGRCLLTTAGSEARVWDATSGRPLTPVLNHNGPVTAAAFSPSGAHVLTASQDGTARLWPVTAGQPPTRRLEHDLPVAHAVFSPDGATVYSDTEALYGGTVQSKAQLWDAATGRALSPPLNFMNSKADDPPIAQFSPESRLLASLYGGELQLWDTRTGRPVGAALKPDGFVYRLEFSPDGREFLTLQRLSERDESGEHIATIWDLVTRQARVPSMKLLGKMLGRGPLDALYSPDGSRLVFAPTADRPNRHGQL
jgi:WD40 repeat protein